MGKRFRHFVFLTTASVAGLHAINKVINYTASLKNLTSSYSGNYYKWRYGNIFFTKHGNGQPLLLIHDLDPSSSSYEWTRMIKKLEKNHTVYTVDLPGCGHSDKPEMIYSNYLFVQFLHDFVKDVIKETPSVAATGSSGSFTIMCNKMYAGLFDKVIIINPEDLKSLTVSPDTRTDILKKVIHCPIIGTFIYNVWMHERHINEIFENKYYYKKSLVSSKFEDIYFESAHIGNGRGRYLLASKLAHYTNISIAHALKGMDNLCLIGSRNYASSIQTINQYLIYNSGIETAYLSNAAYLPQLEVPDKLADLIAMFLE